MPDLALHPPTRRPTAATCACACACTCKGVSPSPSLSRSTLYSPSLSPYLTASWNSPPRFLSLRHSLPPTSLLLSFPPSLTLHFTPTTSPTNHNPRPFLSSFPFRCPRLLIAPTYNRSRCACLLSHQTHNTNPQVQPRLSFPGSLCCACPSSNSGTAAGCLCFIPAAFIHNRPQRRRLRTSTPRTTSRRLPLLVVSQSSPHTLHPRPHSNHFHLGLASHHSCRSCGHPSCGPVYSEPS